MALPLSNNAEGGVDGTVVTIANSGGASGDAFTATSFNDGASVLTYDSAHAAHGTLGYKIALPGAASQESVGWASTLGTQTDFYVRVYLYLTAAPPVALQLIRFTNTGTQVARVQINTLGLGAYDSTGTARGSGGTIPTNQWCRIEAHYFAGDGATTGYLEYKLFTTPDGTTPSVTVTGSAGNYGAQCNDLRFGNQSNASLISYTYWLDDPAAATGSYIGPATTVTPVASLVPPAGTAWLGSSATASIPIVSGVENSILNGARTLDIVHTYRKLDTYSTAAFPGNGDDGASLQVLSDGGRIPFFNFAFKINGAYPAGTSTWSNIASGVYDAGYLYPLADKIASWYAAYGRQIFVSWGAESDGSNGLNVQGTSYSQFVSAWQHIYNVFVTRNARAACSFVFDMTGYQTRVSEWNNMYPGDAYVDWLGYDPYGKVDPATGAPDATAHLSYGEDESDVGIDDSGIYRFYKWANGTGAKDFNTGLTYTKTGSHTLPIMVCETGLSYDATADAAFLSQYRTWWSDLASLFGANRYPLIQAWVFFPSIASYDPRLDVGTGTVVSPQSGSILANFRQLTGLARFTAAGAPGALNSALSTALAPIPVITTAAAVTVSAVAAVNSPTGSVYAIDHLATPDVTALSTNTGPVPTISPHIDQTVSATSALNTAVASAPVVSGPVNDTTVTVGAAALNTAVVSIPVWTASTPGVSVYGDVLLDDFAVFPNSATVEDTPVYTQQVSDILVFAGAVDDSPGH